MSMTFWRFSSACKTKGDATFFGFRGDHPDHWTMREEGPQQIKVILCDPKTELYLLFVNSTLPLFVHMNTFLQQEQSILQKVIPALTEFFKTAQQIHKTRCSCNVYSADVENPSNYVGNHSLFTGFTTKQYISLSTLTPRDVNKFYTDVMDFCVAAACYFQKMPIYYFILKEAAQILDVPKEWK
ncbi:UNVERIFIED_CONTAM: hypothetical protein FKN15_039221 [Acipenser sinensis]